MTLCFDGCGGSESAFSIGLRNARGIRTIRITEPMERRIPIRRCVLARGYMTGLIAGASAYPWGENQRGVAISVTPRQIKKPIIITFLSQ